MPGIKNTMRKTVGTLVSHSRETVQGVGWRREVPVVKESICQCRRCKRHVGLILRSERSPGERHGNPCLYSCLENSMDRGDWQATVHGVTKSQTRLSMHAYQVQLSKFRNLSRKLFWRKLPRVERTDSTFHSDFLLLWDLFQSSKPLML